MRLKKLRTGGCANSSQRESSCTPCSPPSGRYDVVGIGEAPDEKTLMQFQMSGDRDFAETETLIGVSRDKAMSWIRRS